MPEPITALSTLNARQNKAPSDEGAFLKPFGAHKLQALAVTLASAMLPALSDLTVGRD